MKKIQVVSFIVKHTWMYLLLLCALTLASFSRYVGFTFWKDDWLLLWGSLYDLRSIHQYWDHPMTLIEFVWLTKLFGTQPLWWQIFGVALRIGTAVALSAFGTALTSSVSVGLLAGVLFAGTFIGMDAVGWPAAHVTLVSAIFLLIGMTYLIRYLKGAKATALVVSVLYLGIGLLSDPFRNFPVVGMIPLLFWVVKIPHAKKPVFIRLLKIGTLVFGCVAIAGFALFQSDILGSQLFSHMLGQQSLFAVLKKIYVVGNYFNSIANMMFGWLIRFPEDASTGVYNRVVARIGFFVFCLMVGLAYRARQLKSKQIGVIVFSLLWMFVLYIPNWLFEPRLTMGATHRYMVLSSLGFTLALAYVITLMRKRFFQIISTFVFVAANIWTSQYYAGVASGYRAAGRVSYVWNRVNADVAKDKQGFVFLYEGEDPVKTYALALSGPAPFGLMRRISNVYDLPIVTNDTSRIQKLLCWEGTPLNHVYAWRITNDGILTNISLSVRRDLLIRAMDEGCVPMID